MKKSMIFVSPMTTSGSMMEAIANELNVKYSKVFSFSELMKQISNSTEKIDLVIIDIEKFYEVSGDSVFEILHTLSMVLRWSNDRHNGITTIAANVRLSGDPKLTKEVLSQIDIRGVYPGETEFTIDEKRDALVNLLNGNPYIPKKITDFINAKNKRKCLVSGNEIHLTPRQQEVFDLVVKRGASNKSIAKMLHIEESTVKLHISAILKSYGAKNRTQLVVFSK